MKIKIDKKSYKKLAKKSEKIGYSSVEECINHIIEKEISNINSGQHDLRKVRERLRGLGYIE